MPAKDKYPPIATTPPGALSAEGYFYVMQLLPKEMPWRLKLGWTTDIRGRLTAHRCTCPDTKLLYYWPCLSSTESQALRAVEQEGWERRGREVFDCENHFDLERFLDHFFREWENTETSIDFILEGENLRRAASRGRGNSGHIHQLSSGRWRGQIALGRHPNGKRRREGLTADTREEVARLLQELREAIASGEGGL